MVIRYSDPLGFVYPNTLLNSNWRGPDPSSDLRRYPELHEDPALNPFVNPVP